MLLTCKPSALPLLTVAVEHGTPATVTLSLGTHIQASADVSAGAMLDASKYVSGLLHAPGILKALALSEDSRAKTLQDLREWQWQGLAQAVTCPVGYTHIHCSSCRAWEPTSTYTSLCRALPSVEAAQQLQMLCF